MHNRAGNHANVPTHAEMRFLSMVKTGKYEFNSDYCLCDFSVFVEC